MGGDQQTNPVPLSVSAEGIRRYSFFNHPETFMFRKTTSITLLCLASLLVISNSASAQDTISVQAVPLHRFITQNATLGHFLTPNFSEGTGFPYNYAYQPFVGQADIVPLVPGYAPRANQGLIPVHAWQVDQRPRIYYYYSIYFGSHGGDYRYLGVIGYAMAKFDPRGTPFHYWYSQSYGYYYTVNGEYPPCCTFAYHDYSWHLPVGGTFLFDRIPEPEDPCDGLDDQRNFCWAQGREWDPEQCFCRPPVCDPWCEVQ